MRIVSVIGTRPQIVKLAGVHRALATKFEHIIVESGQHYDPEMSSDLYREFGLPGPVANLEMGSGTHAMQTARLLGALEPLLIELEPAAVLVYGDTNTTLAGALVASKLNIKLCHVEAGARSFNRNMPEEVNRVVVDHCADLCLASSPSSLANLRNEGLEGRSALIGDVMEDLLLETARELGISTNPQERELKPFFVATVHRAENTNSKRRLVEVLNLLNSLPHRVRLFVHPRLRTRMSDFSLEDRAWSNISFQQPLGYRAMVEAVGTSKGVLTDSGGLQKEAFWLKVPCVTIREETEWPETVDSGWNLLLPAKPTSIAEFFSDSHPRNWETKPFEKENSAERLLHQLQALVAPH